MSQWKGLVRFFFELLLFMGNSGGGGGNEAARAGEGWGAVGRTGVGAASESSGATSEADVFLLGLGTGLGSAGSLPVAAAEKGAGETWWSAAPWLPGGQRSPSSPPVDADAVLSGSSASSSMLIFLRVGCTAKAHPPIDFLFHSEHSLPIAWTQASRSRSTAPGPGAAGSRNLRGRSGGWFKPTQPCPAGDNLHPSSSLTGTCFCG